MLAEKFTADTPLPQPGSVGYLRGTAQRVRVLRRHPAERTCLVQLFQRNPRSWAWEPVPGSSGNSEVDEADLYATERDAVFCGRPPRGRAPRPPERSLAPQAPQAPRARKPRP